MTLQDAAELLDTITSLWPNYRPPDVLVAAKSWATVLADIPLEQASSAVFVLARRQREFAPSTGLILDTIRELTGQRYPTPDEALAEVDAEIRRVGYSAGRPPLFYRGEFIPADKPVFSCEPIAQAVKAVTWRSLCLADDEGRTVVRALFAKNYAAIVERASLRSAAHPLGMDRQITDQDDAPAFTLVERTGD